MNAGQWAVQADFADIERRIMAEAMMRYVFPPVITSGVIDTVRKLEKEALLRAMYGGSPMNTVDVTIKAPVPPAGRKYTGELRRIGVNERGVHIADGIEVHGPLSYPVLVTADDTVEVTFRLPRDQAAAMKTFVERRTTCDWQQNPWGLAVADALRDAMR